MEKVYTIYHIPGVKVGCTDNLEERMLRQKCKQWEIIEEHTCIFCASDREIELQKAWGYTVDRIPYWRTSMMDKSAAGKIGGKKGGKRNVESGHISRLGKASAEWSSIPVVATDKCTGTETSYPSACEAARQLNCAQSNINACLKGRQKSAYGHYWRYA